MRNFMMGQNLLSLHGLYYSLHGGWWEWAPPCNHFRMPYWAHMDKFMDCVQRLSYLLSQGYHRCDVAIIYPVAPKEAGLDGEVALNTTAFAACQHLYESGIDSDFMDFESLARAEIRNKKLCVSGEEYRVLILAAMKAVRYSTIQKAAEFYRAGGMVIALGALPEASDRAGREDPELDRLVKEIFGVSAKEAAGLKEARIARHASGGLAVLAQQPQQAEKFISESFTRDFAVRDAKVHPCFMHRKVGPRDIFAVYGVPENTECFFRASGKVELWDPWTGDTRPLAVASQTAEGTTVKMPLTETEAQLVIFSPGTPELGGTDEKSPVVMNIDGPWEFELKPTMDNQWGDFRWPAFKGLIGAEARKLKYAEETAANPGWQDPNLDDAKWGVVTCSFGPKFWMLGPMSETADVSALETQLAGLKQVDPSAPVELAGRKYYWQPYEFSWRFGMEKDTAHQGYHGLKEEVADEFIGLGAIRKLVGWEIGNPGWPREKEEGGTRYYLWTAVMAPESAQARVLSGGLKPAAVWLNNVKTAKLPESARLQAGANPVLLRYDSIGRGYFVFRMSRADGPPGVDVGEVFSPAAYWIWHPDDAGGEAERFFRRTVVLKDAPRHAFIRITCCNSYQLYVNGQEVGTGNKWETVQQYDVAGKLVAGRNVIAVKAQAKSNIKGLIAELTIGDQYVATDSNWLSAKTAEKGWNESAFDDSAWTKARQLSNFPDSLWAKHRMGPPKLDRVVSATSDQGGQPKFEVSNLAMRWYNQDEILKFDTRPGERRPVGWYRFVSPPGLKAMTIAARGSIQAWVDGKELEARVQEAEKPGDLTENAVMYKVEIDKPSVGTVQVALRVEQARGCYGGATLPEPISLVCGAGQIALGDWSRIDGLASYSGGAWYRKTIALTNEQAAGRVMIDLGSVAGSVEVHVNGKLAGVRIAPPWKLDVSGLVRNGDNRFEVLVYNTLANHYSTIPTNYRGSPTSGLLGPVKLEFSGSIGEGQKNMKNP
jgi:hypothetical protein